MLSSGYAYHAYQSRPLGLFGFGCPSLVPREPMPREGDAPPGSGPKVLQNLSVAEGLKPSGCMTGGSRKGQVSGDSGDVSLAKV